MHSNIGTNPLSCVAALLDGHREEHAEQSDRQTDGQSDYGEGILHWLASKSLIFGSSMEGVELDPLHCNPLTLVYSDRRVEERYLHYRLHGVWKVRQNV